MIWKYAVRECKAHVMMSVLCLVQAMLLFAIVVGMLSIFMVRYAGYRPVRKLVERKGFICMLDSSYHMDSENGMMVQSSQAYEAMLKDAHVEGQYSVDAFVEEPQEITDARKRNSYYKNVWAYDDAWISGYQPALKSGKWLQTDSTEGEYLEAVVLQNKDQYKTGDVVYVDTNSTTELQTKIPVKIIGEIDPAADIIYRSSNNGSVDYQILFSNMVKQTDDLSKLDYMESEAFNPVEFFISKKNLDRVQEAYADKESEENLSKNYENVLKTKKQIFTTILSGVTLITMDRNCSESVYRYNKNKVAQISRFGFLHDLDYIRNNTWQNIMADLSELIPVGIGMVLFTMISFVTLSTLMYQKNMRKYSIYYVQGLTWGKIFRIHVSYIFMIVLAAMLLGILVILAAGHFGIWSGLAVQLGVVQMIGCLLVVVLLLASSALMCLSMVKGSSAREQYGKGI